MPPLEFIVGYTSARGLTVVKEGSYPRVVNYKLTVKCLRGHIRKVFSQTLSQERGCKKCYLEDCAAKRASRKCQWCLRTPRELKWTSHGTSKECPTCNKTAERNARHECCGAPVRIKGHPPHFCGQIIVYHAG